MQVMKRQKKEKNSRGQNTSSKDDLTETKENETIKVRFTPLNMNINTYGDNKYSIDTPNQKDTGLNITDVETKVKTNDRRPLYIP